MPWLRWPTSTSWRSRCRKPRRSSPTTGGPVRVHGRLFCVHRSRRAGALDRLRGERLDDVLMLRVADLDVKELILADARGISSRRPISRAILPCCCASGISAASIARLEDMVVEAWLTRARRSASRRPGSPSTARRARRRSSKRTPWYGSAAPRRRRLGHAIPQVRDGRRRERASAPAGAARPRDRRTAARRLSRTGATWT